MDTGKIIIVVVVAALFLVGGWWGQRDADERRAKREAAWAEARDKAAWSMGGDASFAHPVAAVTDTPAGRSLAHSDPDTYEDWYGNVAAFYLTWWREEVDRRAHGLQRGVPLPGPPQPPACPPHLRTPPAPGEGQGAAYAPSAPTAPTVPGAPKGTDKAGQFDPKDRSPREDQFAAKTFDPKDLTPDADGFL
ncbi:hypothetical protein TSST111916_19005 [Tsukamurella strandjordii]|uniref:hypothetical protein n=1 Tax=Tsukamurella TaxID=2060 RepID=UPI001C7CD9D4|nr:hypothetical protein [Tsukamurella sp. TY48]GIZ97525.1 hypothetical protein TTY48_21370 [Tsukamurella sp. TY48]